MPLKSAEEALQLRHHVLARFERASADPGLVLSSWAWNYLTADRTARLMVGAHDEPVVARRPGS